MITFGPVPSRRLGKSLGINNIISPKRCSYGCIYCQVGETRQKNIRRDIFFHPDAVYEAVSQHIEKLSTESYPDYLTFVSNGEPTLDKNLGRSIEKLKVMGIPVAVITNGSLLFIDEVAEDLDLADWVSLKADAGDPAVWHEINNPSPELNFSDTIKNMIRFAGDFGGKLCTETMLVAGVNDSPENIIKLADLVSKINPHKAYLAIPTRPPARISVHPPTPEKLNLAWQLFNERNINAEFLNGFEGTETGFTGNIYEDILNITAVHPLREEVLHSLLEKDNSDLHYVKEMVAQHLIRQVTYNGHKYYVRDYHVDY